MSYVTAKLLPENGTVGYYLEGRTPAHMHRALSCCPGFSLSVSNELMHL